MFIYYIFYHHFYPSFLQFIHSYFFPIISIQNSIPLSSQQFLHRILPPFLSAIFVFFPTPLVPHHFCTISAPSPPPPPPPIIDLVYPATSLPIFFFFCVLYASSYLLSSPPCLCYILLPLLATVSILCLTVCLQIASVLYPIPTPPHHFCTMSWPLPSPLLLYLLYLSLPHYFYTIHCSLSFLSFLGYSLTPSFLSLYISRPLSFPSFLYSLIPFFPIISVQPNSFLSHHFCTA